MNEIYRSHARVDRDWGGKRISHIQCNGRATAAAMVAAAKFTINIETLPL